MNRIIDNREAELLLILQRGVAVEKRPLARGAEQMGMNEAEVAARIAQLFERGLARRFGAVFDSRRLGYDSTLCAVDVPEKDIESVAATLNPHTGITHCYEREGHPNLWFTLTAPAKKLDQELAGIADAIKPHEVFSLPATRRFKIDVVFDARTGVRQPRAPLRPARKPAEGRVHNFTEREKVLVRRLQDSLPVVIDPFAAVAEELGWDHDALLATLREWHACGIIRRIGLILRHRHLGFRANSMCVWPAPLERIEEAGAALAACPEVTHCYQRPALPGFPFTLYAMVHAETREKARALFERISTEAGLEHGRMMISSREFKKASPRFFREEMNPLGKAQSRNAADKAAES